MTKAKTNPRERGRPVSSSRVLSAGEELPRHESPSRDDDSKRTSSTGVGGWRCQVTGCQLVRPKLGGGCLCRPRRKDRQARAAISFELTHFFLFPSESIATLLSRSRRSMPRSVRYLRIPGILGFYYLQPKSRTGCFMPTQTPTCAFTVKTLLKKQILLTKAAIDLNANILNRLNHGLKPSRAFNTVHKPSPDLPEADIPLQMTRWCIYSSSSSSSSSSTSIASAAVTENSRSWSTPI